MMKSSLKSVLISLVMFCAECHAACTGSSNRPAQYFSIVFEKEHSDISPEQAQRFGTWASEMLARFPLQQWLSISGDAMPNEVEPNALARRRAVEVAKLALDRGLSIAPIEIKIEVGSVGNPNSYGSEGRSAFIQLSSGCPNDCCEK
ncbi:hypothetical protein [Caballeronia catudaia]|nr:hypothetical protein [Caballeronia catudaia]